MKNAWYLWVSMLPSRLQVGIDERESNFGIISAASGVAKAVGHMTQEDPKTLLASKELLTLRVRTIGESLRKEWARTNMGRKGSRPMPQVSDQTLSTQLCQWSKDNFGDSVRPCNQVTLKALGH